MIDTPREGIKESVAQCKNAGIEVMMITGDHPATAKAVSEKIGLFEKGDLILGGSGIKKMSDKRLEMEIKKITTKTNRFLIMRIS